MKKVKKEHVDLLISLARKYWHGNYHLESMKEEREILFAARQKAQNSIDSYLDMNFGAGSIIDDIIDVCIKRFGNKVSQKKMYNILNDFGFSIEEE